MKNAPTFSAIRTPASAERYLHGSRPDLRVPRLIRASKSRTGNVCA